MSQSFRPCQPFAHQREADAKALPIRMHRQRPQQQCWRLPCTNAQRPETDGTGKSGAGIPHHQRQSWHGCIALAQPVAGLGVAAGTETQVKQVLDRCMIVRRRFIANDSATHGHELNNNGLEMKHRMSRGAACKRVWQSDNRTDGQAAPKGACLRLVVAGWFCPCRS